MWRRSRKTVGGVQIIMRKENIITKERIEIGVLKDLLPQPELEKLEETYPELRFIQYEKAPERDEVPFFIGADASEDEPFGASADLLKDPIAFWDYKRRVMAYSWLKGLPLTNLTDLYEAWYILKFLCQEIHNTRARKLGRDMAALEVESSPEVLEAFRREVLLILTKPSSPARIRGSLWKNYSNQLKKTKTPLAGIKTPEDPRSEETLLEELRILEKEALATRLFFGTSPILYKETHEKDAEKSK